MCMHGRTEVLFQKTELWRLRKTRQCYPEELPKRPSMELYRQFVLEVSWIDDNIWGIIRANAPENKSIQVVAVSICPRTTIRCKLDVHIEHNYYSCRIFDWQSSIHLLKVEVTFLAGRLGPSALRQSLYIEELPKSSRITILLTLLFAILRNTMFVEFR